MKNLVLGLSIGLNMVLLGLLVFLNERYGLLVKVERVVFREGRVPGMAASYEMNRNYQVRREMFRLDRNEAASVLMLGDSLTVQGEWNAMLGEPLVGNRGIDGDTSAGVLARVEDDADFRGDAVVIWIGTNDVLQGEAAGAVVARIIQVVRRKVEIGKRKVEMGWPPMADSGGRMAEDGKSAEALDSGAPATIHSPLVTAPKAPRVFVLSVPPIARWWEGARERNGTIREINSALAASAGGAGFVFVDLHPLLADGDGFMRGDLTSDGVHLNARGYSVVLEKLKEGPLSLKR